MNQRSIPPSARRVALVAGIVLLLWTLWWAESHRRIWSEVASYRARGEIASYAEVAPTGGHGAAALLMEAGVHLQRHRADVEFVTGATRPLPASLRAPLGDADMATLGPIVARNVRSVELLRRARGLPEARWPQRVERRFEPGDTQPPLGHMRGLLFLQAASGLYQHQLGRDQEALECAADVATIGARTDQYPTLIMHLLATAAVSLEGHTLREIAPTLQVGGGAPAASKAQVQEAIARLLDEQAFQRGLSRALQVSRFSQPYAIDTDVHDPIVRPAFRWEVVRAMRYGTRALQASQEPHWPAIQRLFDAEPPPKFNLFTGGRSNIMRPYDLQEDFYERPLVLHFRALVDRRVTAVRLALRLYEINNGRNPRTLGELVPAYLPAVPVDFFRSDGGPLGYIPDGLVPRLYSVGEDGVDNGGAYELDWDFYPRSWVSDARRKSVDAVYPLSPRPLPPAAAPTRSSGPRRPGRTALPARPGPAASGPAPAR